MQDTDTRLSRLFHESTADATPDVVKLVEGGIGRGRIKRRRRNLGTAFAAATAVAIVAVVASVAPGMGPSGAGLDPAGAPAPAKATTPSQPEATRLKEKERPASPPSIPTADIPVKAADLPRLFTKLHPGRVTPAEWSGRTIDDGRGSRYGHFLWNGFATTIAFVTYTGTPAQRCQQVQQDKPRSHGPLPTCSIRPDGTALLTWPQMTVHDSGGISVANSAWLFTNDGYEITAISYNSARTGPPLAAEPPLSIAQLTRAVTSDVWFSR